MVLKTLESPLDSKEIKPVNPKINQPWIFIGSTNAEAPILWPPDAKSWLIGKDPDSGNDWRWEKGMTENEKVWCNHQLNAHEFEQTTADREGQGHLARCRLWGPRRTWLSHWTTTTVCTCTHACTHTHTSSLLSLPRPASHPVGHHPAEMYSRSPWVILHLVVYIFQCYSLNSPHPPIPHILHMSVSLSLPCK